MAFLGQVRPITQPHEDDLIVMKALSLVLSEELDKVFLTESNGFRPGRGVLTFFAQVREWGPVERLIKADVVGCFDHIKHGPLNGDHTRHFRDQEEWSILRPLGAIPSHRDPR